MRSERAFQAEERANLPGDRASRGPHLGDVAVAVGGVHVQRQPASCDPPGGDGRTRPGKPAIETARRSP